jgi:hypothetical protein
VGSSSDDDIYLLRVCWKGNDFEFNHKIMIIRFRSCNLVLWMVTWKPMVCESPGMGLVVQGEDAPPLVHPT